MLLGFRAEERRKELLLTIDEVANFVGVQVDTVNNWERGFNNPKKGNLQALATVLKTTTDYLEGDIDIATDYSLGNNKCIICGKPIPYDVAKCPECCWQKWSPSLLNSYEQEKRRKRSHSVNLLSLDRKKARATFLSTNSWEQNIYTTSLDMCTCPDFEERHMPCKHIYRLAKELGFYQPEKFAAGEYDYTMRFTHQVPDVVEQVENINEEKQLNAPAHDVTVLCLKINEVAVYTNIEEKEAKFLSPYLDVSDEMLLFFSGILNGKNIKVLLTNKKFFLIIPKKPDFEILTIPRQTIKNITVKNGIVFSKIKFISDDILFIIDMISKKASSKFLVYCNDIINTIREIEPKSDKVQFDKSLLNSSIEVTSTEQKSSSKKIFLKIFKYICCASIGALIMLCILGTFTRAKIAPRELLIPVLMLASGYVVAINAKHKGLKGSMFSWIIYGTLVPFISWMDVLIAGGDSQNRVKIFIKSICICIVCLVFYLGIFVTLIEPPKKQAVIQTQSIE